MGDGEGSDAGSTGSDGGPGDGGGGSYDPGSYSSGSSSYSSGGLSSLYDDPNDPTKKKLFGIGGSIDPSTGKAYDISPNGWTLGNQQYGTMSGSDGAGAIWNPTGRDGINEDLMNSVGFKPTASQWGGVNDANVQPDNVQGFHDFLASKGLQLGQKAAPGVNQGYQQLFDSNNNPYGNIYHENLEDDPGGIFGMAVGAMASGFGGFAGTQLAAGMGAGSAATGAMQGAGAGFMGTASHTADFGDSLKGGAIGGVTGGAIGGLNPAGYAGITDPTYAKAFNGAVGAGSRSAIGGGNIGSSVLSSLGGSAISAGGNAALGAAMGDDYNPNYGHEGGSDLASNGFAQPSYEQGGYSQAPQQSTFDRLSGVPAPEANYSVAPGTNSPDSGLLSQSMGQGSAPSKQNNGNPILGGMRSAAQSLGAGGFQPGKMDNMGANLMDLYSRYKGYQNQKGLADNLSSMYGPNSAYAKQMEGNLDRMGAARGTRTQVGARSVALQAALANANMHNAPTLAGLYGNMDKARMGMGSDILRMGMGGPNGGNGVGMLRDAGNSLQNWFSPQGGGVQGYNPASDYNYQNGSDIGFADGGAVRSGDPVVGSRSPVRSGGGGGLSPDAIKQAVIRSAAPASSPNTYVNPNNPASVNAYREQQAGTYARGGAVYGPGGPRTDSIPARLSNGEHVMDARSVNALGGGNNEQGQAVLNQLRMRLHRS